MKQTKIIIFVYLFIIVYQESTKYYISSNYQSFFTLPDHVCIGVIEGYDETLEGLDMAVDWDAYDTEGDRSWDGLYTAASPGGAPLAANGDVGKGDDTAVVAVAAAVVGYREKLTFSVVTSSINCRICLLYVCAPRSAAISIATAPTMNKTVSPRSTSTS